jgi:hypothetical protein
VEFLVIQIFGIIMVDSTWSVLTKHKWTGKPKNYFKIATDDPSKAFVSLTKGQITTVDTSSLDIIKDYTWCADEQMVKGVKTGMFYVTCHIKGSKRMSMHQLLTGFPQKPLTPDHYPERNGLNNRLSNLRVATKSQQQRNKRMSKNNTTGYNRVTHYPKLKIFRFAWYKENGKESNKTFSYGIKKKYENKADALRATLAFKDEMDTLMLNRNGRDEAIVSNNVSPPS